MGNPPTAVERGISVSRITRTHSDVAVEHTLLLVRVLARSELDCDEVSCWLGTHTYTHVGVKSLLQ